MIKINNIFLKFIKDQSSFIITYFINFIFVLIFYSISTNHSVEVIYPVLISIFTISMFLIYRWFKYSEFNIKLSRNSISMENSYTEEEKHVVLIVKEMEENYINEINTIKSENLKKNKFISQWIHNMKTPVAVIDLIIQRFKFKEIDVDQGIKSISEENTRLLNNLEQVLEIFRLEDFAKDYMPEEVRLYELLKSVINEKKNQFIYNKVYPRLEVDEDIKILTDLKWSKVMLEQIVSNAIKYSVSANEKKHIYFTAEKKKSSIVLRIRDEGIGIPDYDMGRLFDPFFTGENGRNFKNSSGIGLFISREISDKLNHKLTIASKVSEGTTVEITYLSKL